MLTTQWQGPPVFLQGELLRRMIEKFPALNPTWSPEVQERWWAAFDRLMKLAQETDQRMAEVLSAIKDMNR